jgi:hypothetical protein
MILNFIYYYKVKINSIYSIRFHFNKLNISRYYHGELIYSQKSHTRLCFFIYSSMCLPIKDGDFDTTIPASSKAFILLTASPFPFWTMAPAWPILLYGGAVNPAMNPTTGLFFLLFFLSQSAANYSAYPPISPIITIPSVYGSTTNFSKTSIKLVPLNGSPPIPTTVD